MVDVLVAIGGLGVIYGALGIGAAAVALEAGREDVVGVVTAALFAGGIVGDLVLAPRGRTCRWVAGCGRGCRSCSWRPR